MTSTTENMKKGATTALDTLQRLDRIEAAIARQEEETAAVRALIDRLATRWETTPTFVARVEEAASQMARLSEQVVNGIPTLQGSARRLRDSATELMNYREGRERRVTVALLLACALPGLLGNLWLAWLAKLL
jgi:methyl-accepting chemotaxis protein